MKGDNKKKKRWLSTVHEAVFWLIISTINLGAYSLVIIYSSKPYNFDSLFLKIIIGMFGTLMVVEIVLTVAIHFQSKIKTTRPAINKKTSAISMIYLRYIIKNNRRIRLILLLNTFIFSYLCWKFPQMNLLLLPFALLVFLTLLIIKEQLLEYRIRKGIFGTNRTEAKALIEFLIKNSEDIDFTDSNGNLRRALLPKVEPATTEQPLPAFGEEASA